MFKITKINSLVSELIKNNEWIDIHILTDDEQDLWLFKSEINTLLKSIGYEELHPKDIPDTDTLRVKVDSDVITVVTNDESNDTLVKVTAFLKLINVYLSTAKSLYDQICSLCTHNKSAVDKEVVNNMKDSYIKYCTANFKLEQLKMTIEHYIGLRNLGNSMILRLYTLSTL